MSGNSVMTPDAASPTPDASTVNAQVASTQGGAMLSQGKWAGVIALIAMITVALCVLGGVGAMVYRTIIDGNAPLTNDITTKLMIIVGLGFISMTAALFGSNSLIAKLMEKLL